MSDPTSRLPPRPSLEQLRKQAKERLRELKADDPHVTLARAQLVVAREYGFDSWPKLVHHVEALRSSEQVQYERLGLSATPPFYRIDWKENTIEPRQQMSDQDWDRLFDVMRDLKLTGLTANGQMSDRAMERLATLDQVTRLSLSGSNRLTDAGAANLAHMPQLTSLDIGGWESPITDAGLDSLQSLTKLKTFAAWWTRRISDAGVAHLHGCNDLERVDLLGTPTGDGAVRALTGKPRLSQFKSGKLLTDAALPLFHQFPVFKRWHDGEIEYSLMSADARPNHLLLDGSFTDDGLAAIAGLDGLFALTFFWHVTALTSDGLKPLADLPNLGFLGCQDALCDDRAMEHIAAIPRLRMLMGQGAVASDVGFAALSRSKTIEYIWGRDCPNLTGCGFSALAKMPALRGLAVSCKNVDDDSLASLPDFAALRELMPMDVPDAGFRHVGGCMQLEGLWCMYCRDTTDAATEHIGGLQLRSYYAGRTQITDRSLEILGRMTPLERLEFWQCAGITDVGVAALARLPRLRELTLSGLAQVTREGAAAFRAGVRVNFSA